MKQNRTEKLEKIEERHFSISAVFVLSCTVPREALAISVGTTSDPAFRPIPAHVRFVSVTASTIEQVRIGFHHRFFFDLTPGGGGGQIKHCQIWSELPIIGHYFAAKLTSLQWFPYVWQSRQYFSYSRYVLHFISKICRNSILILIKFNLCIFWYLYSQKIFVCTKLLVFDI